jgi:hypothetical protein
LLVSGCGPDREPDQIRTIRAYYVNPAVCGPEDADGDVNIQLEAVGDFEPSQNTSESPPVDATGLELAFPIDTLGVEALAELAHPQLGKESRWAGVGMAPSDANISFLLWPSRTACPVWQPAQSANAFPLDAVGTSIGYLPQKRLLLLSGSAYESGDARSLVIDVGTGEFQEIPGAKTPIAFSTITAFGSNKLLVAGGLDPRGATSPGDSARVFDARTRSFETQDIILVFDRSRHAAIVLSNGDTLLVGGVGKDNDALSSFERVSPARPKNTAASDQDLVVLTHARVSPTVLRLSDDSIFIAGGREELSPDSKTVSKLDWLSPDASKLVASIDTANGRPIRVGRVHSFAPMPGGGVLAVGLCLVETPGDECDQNVEERQNRSVAWIRPDRSIHVSNTLLPDLSFTQLVPGTDGAPWLFAKTRKPDQAIWERFLPWQGTFEIQENEPLSGPKPSPVTDLCGCVEEQCSKEIETCQADTECERIQSCVDASGRCDVEDVEGCKLKYPTGVVSFEPVQNCAESRCGPRPLAAPLSIDPGLFVWLEQERSSGGVALPKLMGFRFDTRNAFSRQVTPLIADGPEHLAPGIPPFATTPPINDASQVRYDPTLRTLRLVGPEGKVTVADATYSDVDLVIKTLANPRVGFGEQWFGQEVCAWPQGSGGDILRVRRRGTSVTLDRDGETITCSVASGRHSIALRAPDDGDSPAIIERLTITRR